VCACVCVCVAERERERERERESVCAFVFVKLVFVTTPSYGVATVSRIDKIIGLFCRISSLL